jgi:hypothetical protein
VPDGEVAAQAALRVLGSQVVPSAVEVNQPADGPVTVVVLLEGVEAGVGARTDATQELLGATSEIGHLFDSAPLAPFSIGVDSSRATYDRELLVCCRCGDDEADRLRDHGSGDACGLARHFPVSPQSSVRRLSTHGDRTTRR